MSRNKLLILFSTICFLLFSAEGYASSKTIKIPIRTSATTDSITRKSSSRNDNEKKITDIDESFFDFGALVITNDSSATDQNVLFPEKSRNLALSHFTWGAEFGSSIDMTGQNLSTFDLDLNFGYKNSYIKIAGVGVGIHRSIKSGDNYIPVYAVFRSSFRKKPSLCFLNVQIGYSFNTIHNAPTFGDFSSTLGLGINLMQSRRAKSYIMVSLGNRHFSQNHKSLIKLDTKNVLVAKLQIGVNF